MSLKPYKVCVDARLLLKSGIGRYISEVVPILKKTFDLTCIIHEEGIPFMDAHQIKYIIAQTKIYSIKEQVELPKIIPECDLFWSPHFNIPLFPIKAKKRLVTIHDAYHLAFLSSLSLAERIYAKIFFRMALILSNAVITVSEFSKRELVKFNGAKFNSKIQVILNGVSSFEPELAVVAPAAVHANYFLFVGNVKPHKNLKNAVLAFKAFCVAHPDAHYNFKIVGQQDGFINGDESIKSLLFSDALLKERIEFTGFVDDGELRALYEQAHCLVFPSLYEGFGLPPLEAMNVGTPAIVSNLASMPELCENAVLYFDPLDVDSIKVAMENIVFSTAVYDDLIGKGLIQVKKFSWNRSAQQHRELMEQVLIR